MKYSVYAKVVGSKYLGEVEASSEKEAIEKGWGLDEACVCLCHQCSSECENPEVDDISVVQHGDEDNG
ncbi:MAG: hypothetical protein P8Y23_03785 [Candidatus Lokiarchaeota archaeon]|jgi:hypothetical protein